MKQNTKNSPARAKTDGQCSIQNGGQGRTVVALDKSDYCLYITSMLEDTSTYTKLILNPTNTYQLQLAKLVEEGLALGVISPRQAEYIIVENVVTPIMHALPKIHKNVSPPPMQPILLGIESMNEHLSEWLDSLLQPLVKITPGYLQDSRDILFCTFKDKIWQADYKWITYDVESLYTSIPHAIAIIALKYYLDTFSKYSWRSKEIYFDGCRFSSVPQLFKFSNTFFVAKSTENQ